MKALPLLPVLLLLLLIAASCNDRDADGNTTVIVSSDRDSAPEVIKASSTSAAPETLPSVHYVRGQEWDGWADSPERVKVTVRADDEPHTHYFESLPVAYGWLDDRYVDYEVEELLIASALDSAGLIDARDAQFLWLPGDDARLPLVRAYTTGDDAARYVQALGQGGARVVSWDAVDDGMVLWRDDYWTEDWRDDYGLLRTASVTHLDGNRWDSWDSSPDRVQLKVRDGSSYYFDSLPVATSWLRQRDIDTGDVLELLVANALTGSDMLDARTASFLLGAGDSSELPAVLAFASGVLADNFVRDLGDDSFKVASWNDLEPALAGWHEDHWDDWNASSSHARGIERALEVGNGRKLGLHKRDDVNWAVLDDHEGRGNDKYKEDRSKDKVHDDSRASGVDKSKPKDKSQGSEKSKAGGKEKSKGKDKQKTGKQSAGGGKAKSKSSGGGNSGGKDKAGGKDKGGGEDNGKDGGKGKK